MKGGHQGLDGTSDQRCSKVSGRQGQLEKGHTCRQPFNRRTAIDDDDCDGMTYGNFNVRRKADRSQLRS